ncbi:MAG: DUF4249 family protein [Syntrophothermus sp.]
MKRLILLLLPIAALIFTSCQEEFNPDGEMKEKYFLSCVLRGDTTLQSAFISAVYRNGNTTLPFSTAGTDIRIWYKDTVFVLKDSIIKETGYEGQHQFFVRNFFPEPGERIEIQARMPNGKKLSAVSYVPHRIQIDSAMCDTLIPMPGQSRIQYTWIKSDQDVYYVPRFRILYYKNINGKNVWFEKQVPFEYISSGGTEQALYPQLSSNTSVKYDQKVIDRAMRDLSEGDINKEDYTISVMAVDIIAVDKFLGTYYIAGKTQSDGFTVKLDQTDYSNISGGMGIFGAYTKSTYYIWINSAYIRSFRYNPGVTVH